MNIAQNTQQVLGKNLKAQLQQNGAIAALAFCNEKAYRLTDSMATEQHAKIKRATDKPRNPANKANQEELEHLSYFKEKIAANATYEPILKKDEEFINFYYPIVTNSMCLNCHGSEDTDIKPNVFMALNENYPYDEATGYDLNEVRGIWSISFKRE